MQPSSLAHKYWVQFSMIHGNKVGQGVMEVSREMPVCGERDVEEMSRAVKKALVDNQGLDPAATIQVISWTKFEQPSVLVAHVLPQT